MPADKTIQKLTQASRFIDICLKHQAYMEEIPALAAGVIYKDQIIFTQGYGPATPKTCFRIASISKIFTTVAILQLQEAGKLTLDQPVFTYLNWFKSSVDPRVEKITIRQLLIHKSGITRDGDTLHWSEPQFPDSDHLKKYISTLKLPFTPNTRWKYSNLGYSILGAVIEGVSGLTYEAYLQKHICQKLKMEQTSSKLTPAIKAHLAQGFGRKLPDHNRKTVPQIETNAMASAAGLTSNVTDLLKFVSAQFTGNTTLLTETSKQAMRKIEYKKPKDGISQALGLVTFKAGHHTIYNHSGGFQGYRCNIAFNVTLSIGVVVLTNVIGIDPKDYSSLIFNILNYFLKKPFDSSNSEFAKYEGIYRDIWQDSAVLASGKNLISFDPNSFEPLSHAAVLKPVNKDCFVMTGSDEIEGAGELAIFELGQDGQAKRVRWGAIYSDKLEI